MIDENIQPYFSRSPLQNGIVTILAFLFFSEILIIVFASGNAFRGSYTDKIKTDIVVFSCYLTHLQSLRGALVYATAPPENTCRRAEQFPALFRFKMRFGYVKRYALRFAFLLFNINRFISE